jgi:tRNA modification GTPase
MAEGQLAVMAGLPPEVSVEHCREALQALGEIVGQGFSEAILDSVFSRFCIGK